MAKYAILNNNIVEQIVEIHCSLELTNISKANQLVVEVTEYEVLPEKGWTLEGTKLVKPKIVVPKSITPRQLRIALVLLGIDNSVIEDTIETLQEPLRSIAKITWEYSTEIHRDNPVLIQLAPVIGMTSQQLDQIFIKASTL